MTKAVRAELSGLVWKVVAEEGASVNVGDVILIVESMKMEVPVEATASGALTLKVKEGDVVEEGDVVAEIA